MGEASEGSAGRVGRNQPREERWPRTGAQLASSTSLWGPSTPAHDSFFLCFSGYLAMGLPLVGANVPQMKLLKILLSKPNKYSAPKA